MMFEFKVTAETRDELDNYFKAIDYYCCLWDLAQDLRTKVKHGAPDETVTWDEVRDWFYDHLRDHSIDL